MIADRAGYFRQWAELHGGYDPATGGRLVRWWLSGTYAVARPLARAGVAPAVLTAAAVVVAYAVVGAAALGGGWLYAAAALTAVSGWADSLDGAVAILSGRATRWGYVLDSVTDRAADVAYLLAFWVAGGSAGACVAAGAALGLLEYTRARAGNAGMGEIGVVTVGERPTRVVVTAAFLLSAAVYGGHAATLATVGALATLGVSVVGSGQLLLVVRRRLR